MVYRVLTFQKLAVGLLLFFAMGEAQSVIAAGVANPKRPGKVRYLGKNADGPFAVFSQGSKQGYVVGRDVCLYKPDGHRVTCTSIVRTKPRAAAVILTPEEATKIGEGDLVWPEDLGPIKLDETPQPEEKTPAKDIAALASEQEGKTTKSEPDETEEDDPPEPELPPVLKPRLQLYLAPALSLPFWMNDLRFNAGARAAGTGKIWESGDTIRWSYVGFGARYHSPKNGNGDSAFDFAYHFVPQRPIKDDFDLTDSSVAVESSVWSHQFRLRYLRGATWHHTETSDLLLYSGFGYNYLRARFLSTKTGAATDELVSGMITAHGLEVPVVISWQQFLGDWLLTGGADFGIPFPIMGLTARGNLAYDENTADADKSLNLAIEAINLRRAWFTTSVTLGLGRRF